MFFSYYTLYNYIIHLYTCLLQLYFIKLNTQHSIYCEPSDFLSERQFQLSLLPIAYDLWSGANHRTPRCEPFVQLFFFFSARLASLRVVVAAVVLYYNRNNHLAIVFAGSSKEHLEADSIFSGQRSWRPITR